MTDDTSSWTSLYLVWATLLAGPPIAFGSFILIRRRWPKAQSLTTFLSMLVFILILVLSRFGFRFTTKLENYSCICIAYFAYCFFAASFLRIRMEYIRLGALIVTALPIIVGYVLGTFGFLAVGWIIFERSSQPQEISAGMICSISYWGSPVTDSGYEVHLYKIWNWAPFLQREVFSVSVDLNVEQPDISCSDAFAAYSKSSGTSRE